MGGGPVYDPSPFLGGNQGPVSGGVAKAGYASTLINSLHQASVQKQANETAKLDKMGPVLSAQLQEAQGKVDAGDKSPEAMKAAIAAHDAYDKWEKDIVKTYQPNKSVWSAISKQLKDHAMKGSGGAPKSAPAPAGPQGAPKPTSNAAAAPPADQFGNKTYETMRANQQAAVKNMSDLEGAVKTNNLQGLIDQDQAKKDAQRQIISATIDFRTGKVDLAKAAQTIWDAHDSAFGDGGMKSALDFAYKVKAAEKDPAKVAQADKYIDNLTKGLQAESGKVAPRGPAPKLPSGEQARVFERAGVSPNRDLSQYTPDEWQKVDSLEDKDHQAVLQKARETSAVHGGAHQYQQFQAMTKADTEDISTLKNRIGQIEAITANPQNSLSEDQKRDMQTELSNTRSQLTQAYENVKSAYGTIYGNGDASSKAKPAPVPKTGADLSPEDQDLVNKYQLPTAP